MELGKVRTSLSLRKDIYEYGQSVSFQLFQGNFSVFVGYLIACYKKNISANNTIQYVEKEIQTKKNCPETKVSDISEQEFFSVLDGIDQHFSK